MLPLRRRQVRVGGPSPLPRLSSGPCLPAGGGTVVGPFPTEKCPLPPSPLFFSPSHANSTDFLFLCYHIFCSTPCAAGRYSRSGNCLLCPDGSSSVGGSAQCSVCSPGFSSQHGLACSQCPLGMGSGEGEEGWGENEGMNRGQMRWKVGGG